MLSRFAIPRPDGADRGSVLMLMPACVLVVLILASIAVDMALVHLRQRQAFDVAASAANDAVTAGIDRARAHQGRYELDPAAVRATVERTVAASEIAAHLVEPPHVTVEGDTVEVVLTAEADYLFTATMPGAPDGTRVTARASATAVVP